MGGDALGQGRFAGLSGTCDESNAGIGEPVENLFAAMSLILRGFHRILAYRSEFRPGDSSAICQSLF